MGDPAGIAPEITAGAWAALRATGPRFVALADPATLARHAPVAVVDGIDASGFADAIPVLPVPLATPALPGQPDVANAPAIIESIRRATQLTLDGEASALVTNPIAKSVLTAAGFPHPGHTEFLAALAGRPGGAVMMLASPELRVVPVTVHCALRAALDALSADRIVDVGETVARELAARFGISHPRLAVAGLNPHAGEAGTMGTEEITLVAPAIARLRAGGIDATGPHPPDTLFTARRRPTYDAAICLYHDQALIPLKTLDMDGGVNVTLGLPMVRTSPDHGTAFDIAGRGEASPASLIAALRLAHALTGAAETAPA